MDKNINGVAVGIWKAIGVVLALAVAMFIVTGIFDSLYVWAIVCAFKNGLQELDLANPQLGKAVISIVLALVSFLYLRYWAISHRTIRSLLAGITTFVFLLESVTNLLGGALSSGHYFDAAGKSLLYFEIMPDDTVIFYANHTVSPRTGKALSEVTPGVIYELQKRLQGKPFCEISNPDPNDWFTRGTGDPCFWYSRRPDGSIHLWSLPGMDTGYDIPLKGVTLEVHTEYYEQQNRKAEEEKLQAQAQLIAEEAQANAAKAAEAAAQAQLNNEKASAANKPTPPSSGGNALQQGNQLINNGTAASSIAGFTPSTSPVVYYCAQIYNRTNLMIPIFVWNQDKGWQEHTVAPGGYWRFDRRSTPVILSWNRDPNYPGYFCKPARLECSRVVGRAATYDDCCVAPASHFAFQPNGYVGLYHGWE